ncbi:MAG TPA: hypothetical protein VE504_03410 [Nitrososphaeraceae archaeon]|nr:hypothetical protein [Nitrososphaeraceae archaeon]
MDWRSAEQKDNQEHKESSGNFTSYYMRIRKALIQDGSIKII